MEVVSSYSLLYISVFVPPDRALIDEGLDYIRYIALAGGLGDSVVSGAGASNT